MIAILQTSITAILAAVVVWLLAYHLRSRGQVRKTNKELVESYQAFGASLERLEGAVDSIDLSAIKSAVRRAAEKTGRGTRLRSVGLSDLMRGGISLQATGAS